MSGIKYDYFWILGLVLVVVVRPVIGNENGTDAMVTK